MKVISKGPTICLLTEGGERVISEKIYPADWLRGEKSWKKIKTGEKNSLTEKKILSWCINAGKNSFSRGLRKKFLHKPNHPYPPPSPLKSLAYVWLLNCYSQSARGHGESSRRWFANKHFVSKPLAGKKIKLGNKCC